MSETDLRGVLPPVRQEVSGVTGEVVGIKIGTLVSVYVFAGGAAASAPPRRPRDAVPYKFLDSYTFNDRDIFFGREALSNQLRDLILGHTTTALVGKAAIGKTSLIHAGLVPALSRSGDVAAFSVRDYAAPVAAVRDALLKTPNLALSLPQHDSLTALVTSFAIQTNRRAVIFFDQFERLFSLPLDRQIEFARQIAAVQNQAHSNPVHLVFVLRDIFRDHVADLDARVSDAQLLTNAHPVPGLDREGASRAIAEPLRTDEGFDRAVLGEGLIDQYILPQLLAVDEYGAKSIDPASLQIICYGLYAKAQAASGRGKQPVISVDLYRKLGQASGMLKGYLSDQKSELGVNDEDWLAICRLLGAMAGTEVLQFYPSADLARTVHRNEANIKRWLEMLAQRRLVEAREDGAYALIGNCMVNEIRRWFPEQYDQDTASRALARALADWDDERLRLLTERRRLKRIRDARSLLQLDPRALALLLRSAVAYEADPGFWLMEINRDARARVAIQRLADGDAADEAVDKIAQVFSDSTTKETFHALGEAAVQSSSENVRISAALALSTLGTPTVLSWLGTYLAAPSLRTRWATVSALAWMRFCGVTLKLPALAIEPLISLIVLWLRLRANRVKIASVAASAMVGTILVGIAVAFFHVILALGLGYPNPARQFLLSLAVGVAVGGIVGVAYGVMDVAVPSSRPRVLGLARFLAIVLGFALANAFVIGASMGMFPDLRPLLIGAVTGIGFGVGNEWALAVTSKNDLKRTVLSTVGLALTTGLATVITIWAITSLHLREYVPWQFAGGVNPQVLPGFPGDWIDWIVYLVVNAVSGGLIGMGLAGGLAVGDRLADQLESARYV